MSGPVANPVVHLELRTANLSRACAFYTDAFGWSAETVRAGSLAYLALGLGDAVGGGVVEREGDPAWLPYVEVAEIDRATERALRRGAALVVEPREGPAGWRSIVAAPAGAEVGLWQPKR
jgi:predicted enzyme related to lactoylglutathione lyase